MLCGLLDSLALEHAVADVLWCWLLGAEVAEVYAAGGVRGFPMFAKYGDVDNAVATLDRIRAIDPRSALLHNAELELKYDIAIGQSLGADHVDEARKQLALATRLFPDSLRLKQRAETLTVSQPVMALFKHM